MDEQSTEHSPLLVIVVSGVVFVASVCVFTFIALNPDALAGLFGKTASEPAIVLPFAAANGGGAKEERVPLPHTKHYANSFFSFDYPESFTIASERLNATPDGTSAYGTNEVILVASSSEERYVIRVSSATASSIIPAENAVEDAKDAFMARTERGPNDSIQEIIVGGERAYKDYVDGRIHIGIPKGRMNYDASIEWGLEQGAKGTADFYLGNIEDSFSGQ